MFVRSGIVKLICIAALVVGGCDDEPTPPDNDTGFLQLIDLRIGTYDLDPSPDAVNDEAPTDQPVVLGFSFPVDVNTVEGAIRLLNAAGEEVTVTRSFLDNNKTISLIPSAGLESNRKYTLVVTDALTGAGEETFAGVSVDFKTRQVPLEIISWTIAGEEVTSNARIVDVPQMPTIAVAFSRPVDPATITSSNIAIIGQVPGMLTLDLSEDNKTLTIATTNELRHFSRYRIQIDDDVQGTDDEPFAGLSREFYTAVDPEPGFPIISDDELLTLVQQETFKYFYDFAQPASGMARERNTSGDLVTSGGSGFGIMALIVGMERNFITRDEGLQHFGKILTFLETADRFHGAWSHWINGNTGTVIPFSANDNGGDLVETSFLIQGLLTFRQYLDPSIVAEQTLIDRVNALWETVEWDWYTRDGQHVLYWHWSPDKAWAMNHPIRGYNEALITYVLAASSPTHPIGAEVYHEGWARNGGIVNGKSFYGITLPVGFDYGGPLFFTHYSFLGIDPRNLQDTYADYWTQNVNHTLINQAHAINNPNNFVGYSDENWGFTASDNHEGYSAHSPTNDKGVITPTAALSSFPYTPAESMKALKFFYYKLGDRLWGPYGFYDAFNVTEGWTANSYLAIDQGPIVVMIENHRTGLLWELFMSAPEVQAGLTKLGFTY